MKNLTNMETAWRKIKALLLLSAFAAMGAIYFAIQYLQFGAIIVLINDWNGVVFWSEGWLVPFEVIFGGALISILLLYKANKIGKKYFSVKMD